MPHHPISGEEKKSRDMSRKDALAAIRKAGGKRQIFDSWMRGQTQPILPDGSPGYFRYDVERFIRYECNPANEPPCDYD